jgi:hypothetical protein
MGFEINANLSVAYACLAHVKLPAEFAVGFFGSCAVVSATTRAAVPCSCVAPSTARDV